MEPSEQNIDPNLQDAIRRLHGGHTATADLRDRVARALELETALQPKRSVNWPGRLTIAACLLIAGGVAEHLRHHRAEEVEYLQANQKLLHAMVKTHDNPPASAPVDVAALARDVARPVPKADFSQKGWLLKSGIVQNVEGAVAAELDFYQGARHVTLLNLPAFAFAGADEGMVYDTVVDGHPISGFVSADSINCVIGDTNMPLTEAIALRKSLQNQPAN